MKRILMVAAILVAMPSLALGVFINEIRTDQPGADSSEYFELVGTPGESLDGLAYVVIGDTQGAGGAVEAIIDLTGQSIGSDGYFLAAETTFGTGGLVLTGSVDMVLTSSGLTQTLNFENSDNVTHLLVSGINPDLNTGDGFGNGAASDIDANDDGLIDTTGDWDGDGVDDGAPWASIIDIVALVEMVGTEDLVYGPNKIGPDGTFAPAHVYRYANNGPWTIGAFSGGSDTPGAANPGVTTVPEPATVVLMGVGLAGLGFTRRKMKA